MKHEQISSFCKNQRMILFRLIYLTYQNNVCIYCIDKFLIVRYHFTERQPHGILAAEGAFVPTQEKKTRRRIIGSKEHQENLKAS